MKNKVTELKVTKNNKQDKKNRKLIKRIDKIVTRISSDVKMLNKIADKLQTLRVGLDVMNAVKDDAKRAAKNPKAA